MDEGNCLKYLKREWNRKEGRGNKDIKKGGKLGQGVGALKSGSWNPLTYYGTMTNVSYAGTLNIAYVKQQQQDDQM